MNTKLLIATILGACSLSACVVEPEEPTETAGILCDVSNSGSQNLVYDHMNPVNNINTAVNEYLNFNYSWTCSTTERSLSGNGVPNHAVTGGEFASKITEQSVSATFPMSPVLSAVSTSVKEPGYALNSVKFDPATAGTCPDTATDVSDCNPAAGTDNWQMVALPGNTSPWKFGFGVDESNAHVQPGGVYHYHGIPTDLLPKLNSASESSMTLVGWAVDGFPIYARYGYADANDASSGLIEMSSSYQTINSVTSSRPSIEAFPLGHFESDWEYVEGAGDLDECNGRTGVTPEFPEGIYHYYMTDTYPSIQRCVKGEVEAGAGGPGAGGPPPM